MAVKPATQGYALLEFGSACVVLTPEDAAALFALMCRGEIVTREWSSGGNGGYVYRRVTDVNSSAVPILKPFSVAQYATLTLEEL